MRTRSIGWLCLLLISGAPGRALAAELQIEAERATRAQELFNAAYGPDEGQRQYQHWRATRDLPLETYLEREGSSAAPTTNIPTRPLPHAASTPHPASLRREYLLTEGDVLKISVWQWPDLKDEVIVRPDGNISFPLVGDMQAMGLTIAQVDESLTERLKLYIKEPQVSVAIQQFGGRKVIVLGEVADPGVYHPNRNATVLEAIALAQGFTDVAQPKHVVIIRGDRSHPQHIVLNLKPAISGAGEGLEDNVTVEPEDIIYVPRSTWSKVSSSVGAVISKAYESALTFLAFEDIVATDN